MRSRCSWTGPGRRASACRSTRQTGPLVVSICRRLDGMPLAIELAAARLRSLSLRRPRTTASTSVSGCSPGEAAPPWHGSRPCGRPSTGPIRCSPAPSSCCCGACRCSPRASTWTPPKRSAASATSSVFDVTDLLGSLVDKSLVVAEPAGPALRYRLLETIRQFAAERLAEAGDDEAAAVAAAHCAHFLSVAETAAPHLTGPDQGSWLARLDADQANLRRAAEHAASRPDGTAPVLRLGVALRRYWRARNRSEEALRLLMPALERPEARADPELFAAALITAALAARFVDLAMARQLGEQAVELARQLGDDRLLIESLADLCYVCYLAGEPERGLPPGRKLSSAPGSSAMMSCSARA